MKYLSSSAIWLLLTLCFASHQAIFSQDDITLNSERLPLILVSVPPYTDIVQSITGSGATVRSIVSSSLSSHTFEPTPKDTYSCKDAVIWFGIGEPFEARMLRSLVKTLKSHVYYVNLKQEMKGELEKMSNDFPSLKLACACSHKGHTHHHTHESQYDPHIWMSPTLMSSQIDIIARVVKERLSSLDKALIDTNVKMLKEKCQKLIQLQNDLFSPLKGRSIITAHASYGYLTAPYGIKQYSLEQDGKEPSPQAITQLIDLARKEKISAIFTQTQYPSKGAKVIAEALSSEKESKTSIQVIELDPYSSDFFSSMEHTIVSIAKSFHDANETSALSQEKGK